MYQQKSVFCFEGAYLFWKTICLKPIIMGSKFIGLYEQLQKEYPLSWEAEIEGSISTS
jgi:hypothetical protein